MTRYRFLSLLIATLCLCSLPASADTIFTDNTFNLSNYTTAPVYTSDASVTVNISQCTTCGDPGDALRLVETYANGAGLDAFGAINTTFSYNPATQGAIISMSASVSKDLTASFANSGSTNTFHPVIEQGGNLYVAAISGPSLTSGTTTGYNTIAQAGLTAADFEEFDVATDSFNPANQPNFDGTTMTFGLAQLDDSVGTSSITYEEDYDNLSIDLATTPASEPSGLLLLGAGLAGLFAIARKKKVFAAA